MTSSGSHRSPHPAIPALEDQVIWLTGASSGIGAALVDALRDRCFGLVITARNQAALEHLAHPSASIMVAPADITQPEELARVAAAIKARFGRLDTLIANAGTCEYLDTRHFDHTLVKRVFETNVLGLANTLSAALPLIRQSQRGYLMAMSSSATYLPLPKAEAYGASKAAVSYFMASLRADLAAEHTTAIDVSIICPGFVKTPLTDRNDFPMPMRISPTQAANEILRGMTRRPWEIHFPRRFTWPLKLLGYLPAGLGGRISRLAARSSSRHHSPQRTRS